MLGSSQNSREEMALSGIRSWCETRLPCRQMDARAQVMKGGPRRASSLYRCYLKTDPGPFLDASAGALQLEGDLASLPGIQLGSSIMKQKTTSGTLCFTVYKVPLHILVCKPVSAQNLHQTPEMPSCWGRWGFSGMK